MTPDDAELARWLARRAVKASSVSLVEPYRVEVTAWWQQGIQGTTIPAALARKHRFRGSYSSVRRFLEGLEARHPQVSTALEFAPGEAAQVDFGKGPDSLDPHTGKVVSTWVFVMTLAWSWHMYAELVTDQTVATWLGCHRRAFGWFAGVPRLLRSLADSHAILWIFVAVPSGGSVGPVTCPSRRVTPPRVLSSRALARAGRRRVTSLVLSVARWDHISIMSHVSSRPP